MPNITTYADNETYIGFLKLPAETRKELREQLVKQIKTEIKQRGLKNE